MPDNKMEFPHITVLGGGPAGLAAGYYARKSGLPFTIYETAEQVGGNCITLSHGDFLFDSGAHRFHDKIPHVTDELKSLMGDDFKNITAPSSIYHNGKFIDFPLSPLDLVKKLGVFPVSKAFVELLKARISPNKRNNDFESFALQTYGESIARWFLLGYSEKLWGKASKNLSPKISGNRLKGLTLKTFVIESLMGKNAKTTHLDGSFYYPASGIGEISMKLAQFCGVQNIKMGSKVTRIFHDKNRVVAIEINGSERLNIENAVSTLPLDRFLQIMDPPPDKEISGLGEALRYRHIILAAIFLNKDSISRNASIYFPDPDFPFTRIHEPKQRSIFMSPRGKTSLVAEIPCQTEDRIWGMADANIVELVCSKLIRTRLFSKQEVIDAVVLRVPYAYPVLELGFEEKIRGIHNFLSGFKNLHLSGRNGRFLYSHIHDMMEMGREIIEKFCSGTANCKPV